MDSLTSPRPKIKEVTPLDRYSRLLSGLRRAEVEFSEAKRRCEYEHSRIDAFCREVTGKPANLPRVY